MIPRICPLFLNRRDAGRHVALALQSCANRDDVVVVALGRGGIPVGLEVAYALQAPFDIVAVGPLCRSAADATRVGAISGSGACVFNSAALRSGAVSAAQLDRLIRHERTELVRVCRLIRAFVAPLPLIGRSVVLVGDGFDGVDMLRAALLEIQLASPRHVTVVAPVLSNGIRGQLGDMANASVAVREPAAFRGARSYYRDCRPIQDAEFVRDLRAARCWQRELAMPAAPDRDVVRRHAALMASIARRVAIATSHAMGPHIISFFR